MTKVQSTIDTINSQQPITQDTETIRNMINDASRDPQSLLQTIAAEVETAETKLQAAGKKARLSVRPEAVRVATVTEKFSGFQLTINHDPIGKKKGGNGFVLSVPGERTETTLRLNLREARALRSFLTKNIPVESKTDSE